MATEGLFFKAAVDRVKVDKDGETVVVLRVPEQYKADALGMGMLTETVLDIHVTPEKIDKRSQF